MVALQVYLIWSRFTLYVVIKAQLEKKKITESFYRLVKIYGEFLPLHLNVKSVLSNVLEGFKTLQRRRGDLLKTALSKAPEKSYLRMDDLLLELRGDGLGTRLHRRGFPLISR